MQTKLLAFLFLFFISFTNYSQSEDVKIERSKNKVIIGGKIYYVHIVEQGHTLYSISKLYKVSQKKISIENPDIMMGLQPGQALKIPFVAESDKEIKPSKKYMSHVIKQGETIYSLSRFYEITKDDILLANPRVDINDLQVGQLIRIPKREYTVQKDDVKTEPNYIYHKVKRRQTLYSLSKKYNVTIEQIEKANWDMNGYPKYGQYIRIPIFRVDPLQTVMLDPLKVKKDSFYISDGSYHTGSISQERCDSMQNTNDKKYSVALVLPFFLNKNDYTPDSLINDTIYVDPYGYATKKKKNIKIYDKSVNLLEFYEGFMIAVDSLRRAGLDMDLFVYDTEQDSLKMKQIMLRKEFESLDLIIGRLSIDNLKLIVSSMMNNPVNIVTPMLPNNDVIKSNSNLFQVNPSLDFQLEEFSKFISQYYDKNIVLVHDGDSLESDFLFDFKKKLFSKFSYHRPIDQILFKEVIYKDSISFLEQAMLVDTENVVIVSSNKRPFVSKVITSLNTLNSMDYKITTLGFSRILRFDNIDPDYLFNLSTHTFATYFVNYSLPHTKLFIRKYRKKYRIEPSVYSFQGYDMALYFLSALKRYGRQFQGCLENVKVDLLQSEFKFKKQSQWSGYENKAVAIIKYDDEYQIHKIEMPDSISIRTEPELEKDLLLDFKISE